MKEKRKVSGSIKRTLINILVTIVFGLVYFYITLPAINLQDPKFYTFFLLLAAVFCLLSIVTQGIHKAEDGRALIRAIKQNCAIPAILCIVLAAIYLIGMLISSPILRAKSYAGLLTVEEGNFTEEVEEISFDQIPMLDEASAKMLGDRKLGELSDMVSQFEVANDYTQINYKGRPVRVTPLLYGDLIKWFNNRSEGLPAYLVIDMVTQNVELIRIKDVLPEETGIKLTTDEHFGRYLPRYLRFLYPTFIFDEATFEIDEDGVPYWVCPRIVKRIGLFGGTDIEGAVLVNAVTGESDYYAELPSWVDRVFTAGLIIQQYDYYGMYQNGFINSILGQKNVTVTTEGHSYIAEGDDVFMYTGITSVGTDESNIGFILSNQRTKETKYYPCAGAEEYSAKASAEGIVQHLNYVATFPLLLNISSQPTYFMALKDSAGLVKMYAMVNVQQYQIVANGTTVAECQQNYQAVLAENNLIEEIKIVTSSVTGVIEDIRTAVVGGNTRIYIKLSGDDFYYVLFAESSENAVVLDIGDKVSIEAPSGNGELRPAESVERQR